MRIPRIYHAGPLSIGSEITLDEDASNHVGRVLRMTAGQRLELFDGTNLTFAADEKLGVKPFCYLYRVNGQRHQLNFVQRKEEMQAYPQYTESIR